MERVRLKVRRKEAVTSFACGNNQRPSVVLSVASACDACCKSVKRTLSHGRF
ncbi:hypothetical protein Pint_13872 [Pistacia integerrima]|uniref:Uncharacterized protein n=2 Tax=Pistacia TaxID=55512 RepID=A0ACC1AXL5_9ROSI|nr:hypothetical protein Pint_13872 [Pistacia integerrima]KAJ0091398.1 hypothetical protein Patl1_13998 [Pistacia atlantica]